MASYAFEVGEIVWRYVGEHRAPARVVKIDPGAEKPEWQIITIEQLGDIPVEIDGKTLIIKAHHGRPVVHAYNLSKADLLEVMAEISHDAE